MQALDEEHRAEDLAGKRQDREERQKFSGRIFYLIVGYLVFVGLTLWLVADTQRPVHLTDGVLITLLTTTTASVIGIFLIVANYLFRDPSAKR